MGGLQDESQVFETSLDPWEAAVQVVLAFGGGILSPGRIHLPHGADPSGLVAALVREGIRVRSFSPIRRSLEDLYMDILNNRNGIPGSSGP